MAMAQRRKRRGRFWVHPINQQRRLLGDYYHLVQELRLDSERHHQYFRMSAEKMDELLSIVGPDLRRQSTTYRAAIEPKQRLAVGLRYLASGDSFVSLAFSYRLGVTTVRNSVFMLCKAIENTMMGQYLPRPTEESWREVAQGFWKKWNFPNCLGALDGKHIVIEKPPHSGSMYFNYKRTFSTVLLALVDADYRFRVINVGDYGRSSDGGIYAGSALGIGMERGTLHVPPNAPLPGAADANPMPHVIVADAAFPLKPYLMRPFPGSLLDHDKRIYNYRLSRARMVVENAFGILASRWRIMYRRINLLPENVDSVVIAACVLHNFLLCPRDNQQLLEEFQQQGGRLRPVGNMAGQRTSAEARAVREAFSAFFNSPEGSVSWQERMI
ncbi:protein ALP1-like [Salarias fasciatus]|uniref:protein ALP1-like n=1 Tax=Salarias fasciatus TaxID=181472 RepID=UPI001176A06F|nr:protein ALP1-like [Salarias fasciatus]